MTTLFFSMRDGIFVGMAFQNRHYYSGKDPENHVPNSFWRKSRTQKVQKNPIWTSKPNQDKTNFHIFLLFFLFHPLGAKIQKRKRKQLSNRATMWFNQQKMYLHLQTITRLNGVALFWNSPSKHSTSISTHIRHISHSLAFTADRRRTKNGVNIFAILSRQIDAYSNWCGSTKTQTR